MVQNTALRIISGALKSTPIPALRCELYISPIKITLDIITLKYFLKANYFTENHPVKKEIIEDLENIKNLPWRHYSYRVPGVLRAANSGHHWNIPLINDMPNVSLPPNPPWIDLRIEINLELLININKSSSQQIIKIISDLTIAIKYKEHIQIFTDGSKALIQNE